MIPITAEKANSHQMPEFSEQVTSAVCQTTPVSEMKPDELETHIKDCGLLGIAAYNRYERTGCFADRGEADRFFAMQREAIKARSPATVRAMEERLGIA